MCCVYALSAWDSQRRLGHLGSAPYVCAVGVIFSVPWQERWHQHKAMWAWVAPGRLPSLGPSGRVYSFPALGVLGLSADTFARRHRRGRGRSFQSACSRKSLCCVLGPCAFPVEQGSPLWPSVGAAEGVAPLLTLLHAVLPSGLSDFHKFTLTSKAPLSSKIWSSLVCPCLPLSPEESPFIVELQFPECILQVWQSLPAELLTARCKHFPCIGRKQP